MRSLNCFRPRICCVAKETVVFRSIIQLGVLFAAYLIYTKYKIYENLLFSDAQQVYVVPQGSVISDTKDHALFLTIHLDTDASPRECLQSIGRIQRFVTTICPPHLCQDEILYGVGFGFDFFRKINPDFESKGIERFEYRERSGAFGTLPNTGGDIFIHAKCHSYGKLFELAQAIIGDLPPRSVDRFEDIYGWVYRDRRDLSGFIDGTMNPKDRNERAEVAINIRTGGSYALVQKWIHNMNLLRRTPDEVKEKWIGRTIENSFELRNKPITSHIARMIGSAISGTIPRYRLVRQSQPYGTLSGENGLLFMAYASSTENFDYMLDRMTGHADDRQNDDVMRFSRCVTGNYWYFPSQPEFDHLIGVNL